ncbi:MAG: gamma carbonic anhydrase family protein [Myxococcales bacterium]|nr:gamma carbonic anhydrase family protein [Myxococcales bacterium]
MIEAFKGRSPRVDAAAFVHERAVLIGDVTVGRLASVWPGCVLRGDQGSIHIGDETSIQDGTVIHATEGVSATTVGSRVTVGHGVILHGCTIGDECLIGMGAIVLDNAVVESGAFVGAGALVPPNKIVRRGQLFLGNPGRAVRELAARDYEWIEHSWRAYVQRTREYRAERAG